MEKYTYADYDARVAFPHYIKAIDSGLFNTIQFGKNFGFKPEFDVQCEQLGKVEPFKALAIK
jgi:hypothetical protein